MAANSLSAAFETRINAYTERVSRTLDRVLPAATVRPARLHDAMRYAVFNGGKRIRPLLVYATGECLGVDLAKLDAPAAAIELIHAFSLVHDDLPAMDDDDLRRGKPTVHKRYDEATAILAADALQPLAFSVLTDIAGVSGETRTALVQLIANACGSIGMTGGQAIDLESEGRSLDLAHLEHMYSLKTGALIHASVMSACLLGEGLDTAELAALDRFARDLGVAFQIRDDLLDIEGETHVIGKRVGADQRLDKATYPRLFGLDASRTRSVELLTRSIDQLAGFADAADPLRWIAHYVIDRHA